MQRIAIKRPVESLTSEQILAMHAKGERVPMVEFVQTQLTARTEAQYDAMPRQLLADLRKGVSATIAP
jgi:hypothetical protein